MPKGRSSAAKKAARTRKLRAAGRKAAQTKKRRAAAKKAVATKKLRAGALSASKALEQDLLEHYLQEHREWPPENLRR